MTGKINWIAIPLLPITLVFLFWEWWHFGISNWIVKIGRKYMEWLSRKDI